MAKKSFNTDAAAAELFFPQAAADRKRTGTITPPEGYRLDYGIVETKSRRVQLLMQPSLHNRLKEAAAAQGMSFNEFVHKILEKAMEEE